MRNREEVGLLIPRHIVDIPVVIKIFLTSDFHRLADDANKIIIILNIYLFFRQLSQIALCIVSTLAQIGSELPSFPKTGLRKLTVTIVYQLSTFFHATTFQEILKEQIIGEKIA